MGDTQFISDISTAFVRIDSYLTDEINRLNQKKISVTQAQDNQNRLLLLNQNYTSRVYQYIKMIMVVIIMLLVLLIVRSISSYIPSPIANILSIVVIVVAVGLIVSLYNDMSRRNILDYNQIDAPNPTSYVNQKDIQNQLAINSAKGDLIGSINLGGCTGPQCCASGTIWDPQTQSCIVGCDSGKHWDFSLKTCSPFTTMAQAYGEGFGDYSFYVK